MATLLNRNRQIPGGLKFYIPQLNWRSQPGSFDSIVNSALAAMKANPHVAQKMGWTMTYDAVASEVDRFNAAICESQGWTEFYVAGGGQPAAAPFSQGRTSLLRSGRNVAAGARTIIDWIKSGAEAVDPSVAEARAETCSKCALNERGDWTRWFTVPVSNAIRMALTDRARMNLHTSKDEKLGVCSGCSCPLKLKIHMRIEAIMPKMPKESFDALMPDCWIRKEAK